MNEKCDLCANKAVWFYGPGSDQACDECVPRSCNVCNTYPVDGNPENEDPTNWVEETDILGRKYPCSNWFRFEE
jgi:hypothetical protein